MATLTFAVRANQALLLPTLLVAAYTEQADASNKMTTSFEDAETLSPSGAIMQLTTDGIAVTRDAIIPKLLETLAVCPPAQRESVRSPHLFPHVLR